MWAGLAFLLGGLALLAFQGFYNRYWADDWCYSGDVLRRGLVGAIQGYYDTATYGSDRYSLTFFSGLMTPLWVPGAQLLPLATLLLWLGGLYWDIRLLARLVGAEIDRLTSLLVAAAFLAFTFWLTPNEFQNLVWRSGILTYTVPLIGLTWMGGRILLQALEPQRGWTGLVLIGLASFVTGGFSEQGTTMLLSSLSLGLVLALIFGRRLGPASRQALIWMLVTALLAGLAALVVLLLCPMNAIRQQAGYGPPASLLQVPWLALKFSFDYLRAFLSLNRWALLALVAGGLLLGFFSSRRGITLRRLAVGLLVTGMVVYLLVTGLNVLSAYLEQAPINEERLLLIPTAVSVGGVLAGAWQVGSYGRGRRPGWAVRPPVGALLLFVLLAAAPLVFSVTRVPPALQPLAFFQKRARVWDERDAAIRAAKAAGLTSVDVREIDSYAGILELHPVPNWVNHCAESFYGLSEIRATLSWDQAP